MAADVSPSLTRARAAARSSRPRTCRRARQPEPYEGPGGGAFQPAADVPPGVYQGLWLTSSQIWIAGSSDDLGNVVLHRAR